MKKLIVVLFVILVMGIVLQGCGGEPASDVPTPSPTVSLTPTPSPSDSLSPSPSLTPTSAPSPSPSEEPGVTEPQNGLTAEMAYDGVYRYCLSAYDWSIAQDNPDIMYVTMGEETESEYQVIFRSYTGAFVYFNADKASGVTRMTEYVPQLGIEEEAGTINLFDYLEQE